MKFVVWFSFCEQNMFPTLKFATSDIDVSWWCNMSAEFRDGQTDIYALICPVDEGWMGKYSMMKELVLGK